MPTYTWHEKIDQRTATLVQGAVEYTRVYQAVVDVRVEESAILAYVIAPLVTPGQNLTIGSSHPVDTGAKLSSIRCEDEAEDGKQWKVTVVWSTPKFGSLAASPFSRPWEITWSMGDEEETYLYDYSGTPQQIVNSAGCLFDDLPTRDGGKLSVQVVRNETTSFFASTLVPLIARMKPVINSASFAIDGVTCPALYGKLKVKNAERITEGATVYYRVTYYIEFREGFVGHETDGWRERFLDRGHYADDGSGGLAPCRDADGQIVQEAWPLDGAGGQAALSTSPPAVLGPFKPYAEVSFAALSFV